MHRNGDIFTSFIHTIEMMKAESSINFVFKQETCGVVLEICEQFLTVVGRIFPGHRHIIIVLNSKC